MKTRDTKPTGLADQIHLSGDDNLQPALATDPYYIPHESERSSICDSRADSNTLPDMARALSDALAESRPMAASLLPVRAVASDLVAAGESGKAEPKCKLPSSQVGEVRLEITSHPQNLRPTSGSRPFVSTADNKEWMRRAQEAGRRLLVRRVTKTCTDSTDAQNKKAIECIMYGSKSHIVCVFKDYLIYDDANEFLKRYYRAAEQKSRLSTLSAFYIKYVTARPNWAIMAEREFLLNNIERKRRCARSRAQKQKQEGQPGEGVPLFTSEFFHELDLDDQNVSVDKTLVLPSVAPPVTKIQSYLQSQMSYNNGRKEEKRACERVPTLKHLDSLRHDAEDSKKSPSTAHSPAAAKDPPAGMESMRARTMQARVATAVLESQSQPQTPSGPTTIESQRSALRKDLRTRICRVVIASLPKRVVNFKLRVADLTPPKKSPELMVGKTAATDQIVPAILVAAKEGDKPKAERTCDSGRGIADGIYPLSVKLNAERPTQSESPEVTIKQPKSSSRSGGRKKGMLRRKTCDDIPDSRDIEMLSLKYKSDAAAVAAQQKRDPRTKVISRCQTNQIPESRTLRSEQLLFLPKVVSVTQSHAVLPPHPMRRRNSGVIRKPLRRLSQIEEARPETRTSPGHQTPVPTQRQSFRTVPHSGRKGINTSIPETPENSFQQKQRARAGNVQVAVNPLRCLVKEGYLEVPRDRVRPASAHRQKPLS